MPHYITTHDADGRAIFSDKTPQEHTQLPAGFGHMEIISTAHSFPANISTEADIDQYNHDRQHGLSTNFICPERGTAAAIVSLQPNSITAMHRTMTLDVMYVIEGVLELHLDSGEKRTVKTGDTIVQRGTMHKWHNITPNDGWARTVAFGQPIVEPLEVGGRELGFEWIH